VPDALRRGRALRHALLYERAKPLELARGGDLPDGLEVQMLSEHRARDLGGLDDAPAISVVM
jgi:hypothetical protein